MNAASSHSSAPSTTSSVAVSALHELVERLASQVDSAHTEIGETRAILKDAVERLMPAFTAHRSDESGARNVQSADAARATRAARASGHAFSALQFQDISDQLLAHAQVRLALLLAEVNTIAAALAPGSPERSSIGELMQIVASANQNLATFDVTLLNPVGSAHLGTGDMELF